MIVRSDWAKIIVSALITGGLSACQPLASNIKPASVSEPTPITLAEPASSTATEQSIHQQVNQYRRGRNLSPLQFNDTIAQQARIHSQRMAAKTVPFSHQGFEQRVRQIGQTIPYQRAAENVAVNQGYQDAAQVAVGGWRQSPAHHKNMVGDFDLTGVGVAVSSQGEYYFTQIFLKRR